MASKLVDTVGWPQFLKRCWSEGLSPSLHKSQSVLKMWQLFALL